MYNIADNRSPTANPEHIFHWLHLRERRKLRKRLGLSENDEIPQKAIDDHKVETKNSPKGDNKKMYMIIGLIIGIGIVSKLLKMW